MITSLTTKAKKRVALLGASALVALSFTTITAPAHAAAPQCTPPAAVVSCQGVTSDGAGYVMQVPGNFNGTAFIFSHGYRYNIDIPAAIPLIGGYKVTNTPQPGPILAGNDTSVMKYMLSKGYAIFAKVGMQIPALQPTSNSSRPSRPNSQRQSMLLPGASHLVAL